MTDHLNGNAPPVARRGAEDTYGTGLQGNSSTGNAEAIKPAALPAALPFTLPPPLAALAEEPTFCLYKTSPHPDKPGKLEKFPCDHRGVVVDPTDPANHMTAELACQWAAHYGPPYGVAKVFPPGGRFFFLDIDNCLQDDGQWSPLALTFAQRLPGVAIEVSASGRGWHLFGRGPVPEHSCRNTALGIELYTEGRFVALTGTSAMGDAGVTPDPAALRWLVDSYFPPRAGGAGGDRGADWTDGPCPEWRGPTDDAELLRRAMRSQGTKAALFGRAGFADLWEARTDVLAATYPADASGSGQYNASSADAALAQHLAFWTGRDCERIERLMRQSALHRQKWDDRDDYLPRTILGAVAGCRDVLQDREVEPLAGPAVAGVATDWPAPQPLTAKIDRKPYPLNALPDRIREAVTEVQAFVQAPLALVAGSALGAVSLAGQALADVRRDDKLDGPAGLFLLTIADSGERKSTCDGFFYREIRDFEAEQAELAKPAKQKHTADREAWEAKQAGVRESIKQAAKTGKPAVATEFDLFVLEQNKPKEPNIPRLIYADVTPEALAHGLGTKWPSAGVVSAEAGVVFGSHAMARDSVTRNLATLNTLWDGNSLTIDRRTSDSFTVRGARLTVALQVQEQTLREFYDRAGALARGSGFMARFLIAWPESTQGSRSYTAAPAAWPALSAFNRRIADLLNQPAPIDEAGGLKPTVLTLTPEARRAWIEFYNGIESSLAAGGELHDVRDVASKTADNAARLAGLFHVFEHGTGGAIGLETFKGASRLAEWHLHEARRFFGELALPPEQADAARLDAWLIEQRTPEVNKRYAQQRGPVRDGGRIDAAIRELVELDRVQLVKDGKRHMLKINPALLGVKS